MKHNNTKLSPFKKEINEIKNFVNQQKLFSKMSFNEYINSKKNPIMLKFKKQYPEIAEKYFDIKFENNK